MENNIQKINSTEIKNILTLRYNPEQKTTLPILNSKDFIPNIFESDEKFIEKNIINSIKKSLNGIKKTSIALSGGIDSSLMLALTKKALPELKIKAFSVKFANSPDESSMASDIAKNFQIEHETIFIENFLEELPKAISITKQPFWDLHWYYVVKNAKKFSNRLISGDGGDELFGGYTFRYEKFLSLTSKNEKWNDKVKNYINCHERDWVPDQESLFGGKINFSWDFIYKQLQTYFDNQLPDLEKIFLADYNGKLLYNFNPINSIFHNYFKMKSISPLLDKEIIQYATHLDSKMKYDVNKKLGKIPLRKILADNLDFDLINPIKQGFSINTINLWKDYGFNLCEKYVLNGSISKNGWINEKWILKYLKENLEDVRYINKFLGLLALEIWNRIFVTKEMNSDTKLFCK